MSGREAVTVRIRIFVSDTTSAEILPSNELIPRSSQTILRIMLLLSTFEKASASVCAAERLVYTVAVFPVADTT